MAYVNKRAKKETIIRENLDKKKSSSIYYLAKILFIFTWPLILLLNIIGLGHEIQCIARKNMKILLIHNFYKISGGEDTVFFQEKKLLENKGHHVFTYTVHNDSISDFSKLKIGLNTIWNFKTVRELKALIKKNKPDIAHFHNTFPIISPSSYNVLKNNSIPVVQTLHNFRLFCANGYFFRSESVCELCSKSKLNLNAIRYGCYRSSKIATMPVVAMQIFHHYKKTWVNQIDKFIVLSEFSKEKFVSNGLIEKKITIKSNFLNVEVKPNFSKDNYAIFVGRLSAEKGITTLIDALPLMNNALKIIIVGNGYFWDKLQLINSKYNVITLGYKTHDETLKLINNASFLLFPSIWYENQPMTIIESFACGTPIIASKLGAMCDLVADKINGLHFQPGNSYDLAEKVNWMFAHSEERRKMSFAARIEYEQKYTAEKNYHQLIKIYNEVKDSYFFV